MTFTGDCPEGRSQDLTCAEADGKIVIDKMLVNKLTELLITSIYSVHISRRSWGGDKEVYEIDCIRVAARIPC
jgi:hypothetical protein